VKYGGAPRLVGDRDHHRVVVSQAGSLERGGHGASQKHGGTDQEERRRGDLGGNQHLPGAARTRIHRHLASHRSYQFEACGLQRRREPEDDGAGNGAGDEERVHPPVGGRRHERQLLGLLGRHHRCRRVQSPLEKEPRDQEPGCRCRQREQETLRQQLPHDAMA
jgi:hypothetical protein